MPLPSPTPTPPPYTPGFSFTGFQALNPSAPPPGSALDGELASISAVVASIEARLAVIQRNDGALANQSVMPQALDPSVPLLINALFTLAGNWTASTSFAIATLVNEVQATYLSTVAHISGATFAADYAAGKWLLLSSNAISSQGAWVASTSYFPGMLVIHSGTTYLCVLAHMSGVFATDLAAGDWVLLGNATAFGISYASLVGATPADVGDALDALYQGTIQGNSIVNSKLAQMAAGTIKSNVSGSLANSADNTLLGVLNAMQQARVDIASATSTGIGGATSPYVRITGTVSITSFDAVAAGIVRNVVFGGALTLTYNSTSLILPGQANITTVAGDAAVFISEGSGNWRCLSYEPASWVQYTHGECRLSYTSSTQITLSRYHGYGNIVINGVVCQVPSAGVPLANTSLTPATLYYVYTFMSSGVMTLEASVTSHTNSAGIEIKTGDATRTFVGWVYMGPGSPGTFVDNAASRTVVSYFNRRARDILGAAAGNTTSSTSYIEINSACRVQFIATGVDAIAGMSCGNALSTTAGTVVTSNTGLDGTTAIGLDCAATVPATSNATPVASSFANTPAEGFHYATPLTKVNSNSGTWSVAVSGWMMG